MNGPKLALVSFPIFNSRDALSIRLGDHIFAYRERNALMTASPKASPLR